MRFLKLWAAYFFGAALLIACSVGFVFGLYYLIEWATGSHATGIMGAIIIFGLAAFTAVIAAEHTNDQP